jgi:RNA-binding protein
MDQLTAKQRARLKSLAHPLKPILQIGREGVTDALAKSVEDAFHNRELLKVKVLESAPADAREVGSIGKTPFSVPAVMRVRPIS